MTPLPPPTLLAAAAALRSGEWTPSRLDAALRNRDDDFNCFTWRAQEAVCDPAGDPPPVAEAPLWGIGGVVKANICVRGEPTDCGSRFLADWRPPYDATVVTRLQAAGARLLGATVMDEFGMGSSTEHSAVGPARNPHDPTRVPGGSSGGAAAAVAAGLAYFGLGSDTGGSVRQPAHCCGIVGLRPTYGAVSRYGLVAYASSLDQIGPLARTVGDCAAVYAAISGRDPHDDTTATLPQDRPPGADERPAADLVVGVPRDLLALADDDTGADFARTLALLGRAGVTVIDVTLPDPRDMLAAYYIVAAAEAFANLARFDGLAYGARVEGSVYKQMAGRSRTTGFGREVKRRILMGAFVLSEGHRDAYYERAMRARHLMTRHYLDTLKQCDVLATPTAPTAAFPLGERLDDPRRMYDSDVFTVGPSLACLPALTVPTGRDRDGLPLSLQLTGRSGGEETLFTLGAVVEQAYARERGMA